MRQPLIGGQVLAAGTQLGAYQVIDQIGAGGMGEVYRATDTKLGRDVAIKTLPTALAQEPDRLARFEREAKLLATLNHAHIGAIYGLDEHEGTRFIAMELVEGQTLGERLRDGPLPVEDALQIALQIAEALEAAHEKGVVHRDLKPANIMLTPDGVVKVLDYGLAKAFSGEPSEASPAHSPALSLAMTQQGLILGTAGYMSPEQASGQATDQRADIWAFGVVLYEMLTGLPLFSGESVPHVLADVLRTDPDWNRLPEHLHPRLKLLLERCLRKKVRDRYHSIADVRVDIEEILRDPKGATATPGTVEPPIQPMGRLAVPVIVVAVVASLAGLVIGAFWPEPEREPPVVTRFEYVIPAEQVIRAPVNLPFLAISPDGRHFVYNTDGGLYLRAMDEFEPRQIAGTEELLATPAFSPDGQWIVYAVTGGLLKRIAISGGAPVVIAEGFGNAEGISWSEDGTILIGQRDGIYRVAATGGTPELIIPADEGVLFYSPELLPDGDSVMFTSWPPSTNMLGAKIMVESLSTGERTELVNGDEAHYLPTGHLVYTVESALFTVRFDPNTWTVSGGPIPLVQGILRTAPAGYASYDVSKVGTLVYAIGEVTAEARTMVWVDREGNEEPIANLPPRAFTSPHLSPDGSRLAVNTRDQENDVYTWDLARGTLTRFSFNSGQDRFPAWSPDGQWIYYNTLGAGGNKLVRRPANGSGAEELLVESDGQIFPTSFVPNSADVLVYGAAAGSDDIAIYREGEDVITPLLATAFDESMPELSPDGNWLAYVSNESGQDEVYVRRFPDIEAGGLWQVSTNGGTEPLWARQGSALFYRSGTNLMSVSVETDSTFAPGTPEIVFEGFELNLPGGRSYDASPDGERFLIIKAVGGSSAESKIRVVTNWFEELNSLAPPLD